MKRALLSLSLTAGLAACGEADQPPLPAAETQKVELCSYGCGGVFGATTVFSASFNEQPASTYYREADNVLRFDSDGSWTEYRMVYTSSDKVDIQVYTPNLDVPGTYDQAILSFTTSIGSSTNPYVVSVDQIINGRRQTWESGNPNSVATNIGLRTPSSSWFRSTTKMVDLMNDPI